jgi:hypothetical protein
MAVALLGLVDQAVEEMRLVAVQAHRVKEMTAAQVQLLVTVVLVVAAQEARELLA